MRDSVQYAHILWFKKLKNRKTDRTVGLNCCISNISSGTAWLLHMAPAHVTAVSSFCILVWSIGRIVCHITSKMGKTIAKLLCFGSFAGAWAQNEGLRRLKPCQLQITVQDWHCECDKLRPDATFQLLAVCGSWTRGHRANKPCLSRLQFQIWKFQLTMEVTGKFLVYYWRLVRDL